MYVSWECLKSGFAEAVIARVIARRPGKVKAAESVEPAAAAQISVRYSVLSAE